MTDLEYLDRAEALLGYGREELLGLSFQDLVHPDFRDLARERALPGTNGRGVQRSEQGSRNSNSRGMIATTRRGCRPPMPRAGTYVSAPRVFSRPKRQRYDAGLHACARPREPQGRP